MQDMYSRLVKSQWFTKSTRHWFTHDRKPENTRGVVANANSAKDLFTAQESMGFLAGFSSLAKALIGVKTHESSTVITFLAISVLKFCILFLRLAEF